MQENFLHALGFSLKENSVNTYKKLYPDGYIIQVDNSKNIIDFGGSILVYGKQFQNITKPEDSVVLECVDRLLTIGYKAKNITLEKVYPSGHGFSARLDICVTHDDGSEYMLIECKTYGKEYEKELQNMQKSGGQLFTYFKFSNTADILMLYTSQYKNNSIEYIHNFVPIQEEYRKGDVANFYNMWNKQFESTGVLDSLPYQGQRESFTKKDLRELTDDESKKIFHSFASILRKHSVSDKPNAFNKIFNLFLAKLFDEAKRDTDQLEFCWKNNDHPVDFQVRLINLYKQGLYEFLKKEIAGIEDADFQYKTDEELREKKKKILKFNNVFAIKDVIDDESFDENQRVLREVVQLLEVYQIRYPRKQQHLSDFFERLLTTGLKQEVGQYFTPPPITKFIMRSLPLKQMITQQVNTQFPKLPAMIDYAAGSGHFITEALEEYQDVINSYKDSEMQDFFANAKKSLKSWQVDPYSWAAKYIYGIEKDYRLVKVAKVGCYFYGDGVAQVIHGDGLDSFKNSRSYTGLLSENTHLDDSTKGKFSFVLSNPPYSVSDCKDDLEYIGSQDDFTLYPYLSDKSRDIECLFIERTKHLLQDRGIAALVLPSSILHNTGIQTKTREIILRYFDIISIVELGSNTFMATGTNTVILFLRRRNSEESLKIQESIKGFFTDFQDVTLKGIVHPFSCYAQHVWDISLDEYIAVLQGNTSEKIKNHEIYKQYQKKIKSKNAQDFLEKFCTCEQEKILYFILTFSQKVVHIKSGEKQEEKNFLGYYFSDRRNHEGMHSMQSGKTIHEATQLYNVDDIDDETKASSYINKAFLGDFESPIHPSLTQYVARHRLVDMLTFDRADFEKTISLSIKKKVRYNEIWGTENIILLGELAKIEKGTSITSKDLKKGNIPVIAGGQRPAYYHSEYNREGDTITVSASGAYSGFVNYFQKPIFASDCNTIISKDERVISTRLIYIFLKSIQDILYSLQRGQAQPHVYGDDLSLIKIPLPPKDIQQKIVDEIGELEKIEKENSERIGELKESIESLFEESIYGESKIYSLSDSDIFELGIGKRLLKNEILEKGTIPVYSANVFEPFGFVNKNLLNDFSRPSVLWGIDGDWMVNGIGKDKEFYPTDHCGFLRVKEEKLSERFVAYFLNKEGKQYGFSRTKRASIDRIQNIKIPLPPLETQKKIVAEIEILEGEIEKLQAEIECIPEKKKEILKKYL